LPDESTDGYIILRDPLKEEENKLENRGPIPSPYCYVLASIFMEQKEEESDKFTMEELDQLLGDGVTKNGFDIGQRPIYPDSKDLEQRWKNLSV
jgi:hypothetical protein